MHELALQLNSQLRTTHLLPEFSRQLDSQLLLRQPVGLSQGSKSPIDNEFFNSFAKSFASSPSDPHPDPFLGLGQRSLQMASRCRALAQLLLPSPSSKCPVCLSPTTFTQSTGAVEGKPVSILPCGDIYCTPCVVAMAAHSSNHTITCVCTAVHRTSLILPSDISWTLENASLTPGFASRDPTRSQPPNGFDDPFSHDNGFSGDDFGTQSDSIEGSWPASFVFSPIAAAANKFG